jgi:hypothetical protein
MVSPYTKQTVLLMVVHYSHLSERDRRHYAGIETVKLGRGGTSYISKLLGICRTTITSATKQLEVCHYPPYCSKWNPIEHRLFSQVHNAMPGVVFSDYLTIERCMAQTTPVLLTTHNYLNSTIPSIPN